MGRVHTQLRPLLKVVPKGGWAHSWCPTVVTYIFPSKMGAHKPGLVKMQQTWVTSGVSVWYLLTGDLPSKSITLHKIKQIKQIKPITWASSVVLPPVAFCLGV